MSLKVIGIFVTLALLLASTACSPMPVVTSVPAPTSAPADTPVPPPPDSATAATEVPPAPTVEPPLAARVNGQPIYLADYERQLSQYEASLQARGIAPDSPEGQEELAWARDWILNAMIEQALTEQAAVAAGIVVSEDEIDAYMQDMIAENGGEEAFLAKLEQFGDTYENARQTVRLQLIGGAMRDRIIDGVPTTAEHVHARHILVDTAEEAEHILGQLKAGADFATLARTYSQDVSTRDSGGDLGFFPQGILIAPEVEAAAFALQPGQFSEVVPSTLGYHIVQVVERDPARSVSPDNLRRLREQAVQNWTKELWAQADVQRFIEPATP